MPPPTNYYHSHNLSAPKIPYHHEDTARAQLRSFRFPIHHPIPDSVFVYPTESQEGKGRHSAESQTSLGYESDTENIAMPSPTVPCLTRSRSAQTRSGPTSGRSDNTVWEGREEPSILPGRRHLLDGASFSRPRNVGIGSIPASEEGVGGRSSDLEREPATASQLHPYVRNLI